MRHRRPWVLVAIGLGLLSGLFPTLASGTAAGLPATSLRIGAASTDVTPPSLGTALGRQLDSAEFVPACGASEAVIASTWPGKRLFAFTDPYVDLFGAGQYVPGDPYCDADHAGRYQAPYLAGGSGQNRWPTTSADTDPAVNAGATDVKSPNAADDPVSAQAVVFELGSTKVALVTVNSIGIFDSTMDQIRTAAHAADPTLAPDDIFISSTHDESAPDPIGLWGPNLSQYPSPVSDIDSALPASVSSGVDNDYMSYMVRKVAGAIVAADRTAVPGSIKVAIAHLPANVQSCWSSYPFVDDELMPVMQGESDDGAHIFTLVNAGIHDETLGFSGNPSYASMISGDWTGRLSQWLSFAGDGVGMEMASLVGSVETPARYPSGTQVSDEPGSFHNVPGNPTNGCQSVYPEPKTSTGGAIAPQSDALAFVDEFSRDVAVSANEALRTATTVHPQTLVPQTQHLCLQLQNNLFAAAFGLGLFPGRPIYADPGCTVGLSTAAELSLSKGAVPADVRPGVPGYLETEVGVLTLGSIQIAFSPGEVFPFTEIGGPVDEAQMPFPTDCYAPNRNDAMNAAAGSYDCGSALPMTADVAAGMTEPYRFLAGLGEDMLGYMFPPGDFVGTEGEVVQSPWALYEDTTTQGGNGKDRFDYGHADDPESVGPYVGLSVTKALTGLLAHDGTGTTTVPGLYVDAQGHRCDSPFPANAVASGDASGSWVTGCAGFSGAVGVVVLEGGSTRTIDVGSAPGDASGWATYLATADHGTAATSYAYSVDTRGVILGGIPLLIDVVTGANDLGGTD